MAGFIQITDTHIVAPGALAYRVSDTAAALRTTIDTINVGLHRLHGIDCVIVTGDLTDHGTPEEYAHFAELMDRLDLPWMAVPGNHDQREPMRVAFADKPWMPEHGPIHWLRDFGPFAVIALDTLLEGAHHGELCPDGLAFVDDALTALGEQPVIVVTHHPWMHTGIPVMDTDNLRNGGLLLERLHIHPGPVRMLSGHVHRAMTGVVGRVVCQIGPSSCHGVLSDHRPGWDPQLMMEPGGFTVMRWHDTPTPGLISDVIPTGTFEGPYPFKD